MVTMKVTVQPLPHPHSWGTCYGMGLAGGSQAFSWTSAAPQRGGFSMGRGKLPEVKMQLSGQHLTSGRSTAPRAMSGDCLIPGQCSPTLSCGAGGSGCPLPDHLSGQNTDTWVAKGPGHPERGWGPREQGLQGRGVGGVSVSGPPGWETVTGVQGDTGPLLSAPLSLWTA